MSWMEQLNKNRGKGLSAMFSSFMKGSEVEALAAGSAEEEISGREEEQENSGNAAEAAEIEEAPVENALVLVKKCVGLAPMG